MDLKNYSGIIKEPTTLFNSIYLIQNYREIAASYNEETLRELLQRKIKIIYLR